jgi:hypothetical protein
MSLRSFDLNIEEVLENWEVEHAIREVIANALDEQVISRTAEIEISKDDWRLNISRLMKTKKSSLPRRELSVSLGLA